MRFDNYTPRHPSYEHQRLARETAAEREFFAFLMGMRTGKTKTTLDEFGELWAKGEVDDLLIIAPAGVYETWDEAILEHWDPRLSKIAPRFIFRAGKRSITRLKDLGAFLSRREPEDPPRVLIVNIEALSAVERAQASVMMFAKARRCYVAIDESTSIANPKAIRSKFIINQVGPEAKYRRILCGLVAPRGPLSVYSQFQFLKPGILGFEDFTSFRAYYCVLRKQRKQMMSKKGKAYDREIPIVLGFKNEDDLRQRVQRHSFRRRLEDCYDIPQIAFMKRYVELTSEQERIYNQLKLYSTAELEDEGHVSATMVIVKILKLHQILCGLVVDEEGNRRTIQDNRGKEVLGALEEYDGKAIIWCAYDHSLRSVVADLEGEYGRGSVARFWGGNRDTREEEERRFKTDPRCRFMVATAGAGGRGRTWDMADLTIYHSCTNNLEHREQSEERMKNVGKTKPMTVVDLIARETVDEKIIAALRKKIDIAALIQGDAWREWVV